MGNLGISAILLLAAVICFVLAALGVRVGGIGLTDLGLALGFGAFLLNESGFKRRI